MSATTEERLSDDAMMRGEAPEEDQKTTAAARDALALADRGDATLPARHQWDRAQVEVIRQTVAKDCNPSELAMFLEVAARYQLDPFLRELFAAKFNGLNGPVTIFAGRDGLLKAAKLGGQFVRMQSAVVRASDVYEVEVDTDRTQLDDETGAQVFRVARLLHKRKGMGTGEPIKDENDNITGWTGRGPIIGAWALVWVKGDDEPWFAEATWEDYGADKQKTGNDKATNWTIGKGYTEAMMVKVPQSIALRAACGLAGIYAQEEVQKLLDDVGTQDVSGGEGTKGKASAIQWPEGELGMTLQALFRRCNELVPRSWPVPKQAMNVNGKSEEQLRELVGRLRSFIGARAADDPLAREAEPVTDAEVVPDAPRPSDPPAPGTKAVMMGVVPDAVVRTLVAQRDEGLRQAIQGRCLELTGALQAGDHEAIGFDSIEEVQAELDRLSAALREATNGGPTVAEEVADADVSVEQPDDEPPTPEGEWSDDLELEWVELTAAEADLVKFAEQAEGELATTLQSNLDDVRARIEQLRPLRPADADAE